MGVKVAVVGAGSTYTPELVEGFVRRIERFPVDELALLDVDTDRLDVVGGLVDARANTPVNESPTTRIDFTVSTRSMTSRSRG